MDLTNSAAEGWRMRSRKSCQASGAVEDPKASAPPSIVAGSGGGRDSAVRISGFFGSVLKVGVGEVKGSPRMALATRRFSDSYTVEVRTRR